MSKRNLDVTTSMLPCALCGKHHNADFQYGDEVIIINLSTANAKSSYRNLNIGSKVKIHSWTQYGCPITYCVIYKYFNKTLKKIVTGDENFFPCQLAKSPNNFNDWFKIFKLMENNK